MSHSNKSRKVRPRRYADSMGGSRIVVLIIVLVLLAAAGGGIIFLLNPTDADPNRTVPPVADRSLTSDKFYDGVFVDDIPLGGLTMDEARQQVEARQKSLADSAAVTVTNQSQTWQFKLTDVPYTFDTEAVLAQAWSTGRQGTNEERKAAIKDLPANPVKLKTAVTADPSSLEQKVRDLAAPLAIAPVDATFAGYDQAKPDGQRLSFNTDVPGQKVDEDALWAAVKKEFDERTFGAVTMQVVPVQANITLANLQKDMKLVVRFKSYLKDHSKPRYTNISIASDAVSGKFVMPGDTFSFNDTTGERTATKGYQEAHVINGGVVDNGLAGGTCQASGTLFNALARADLEIVERVAHSLKSGYLPLGEDATVDYGHYDLKIRNNKDKPVLLIMYLGTGKDKNYLFAEVYGQPIPDGQTIDLDSTITQTVPAPTSSSTAPSSTVKRGTTETVKPHDGWKVTTYKVYYKNGKEVSRTVLYKSYYREAGEIILYNPADGKPTPTPRSTPTPAKTPAPGLPQEPTGPETSPAG